MFFCLKINIHSYLKMQKGLIGVIVPVYKVEEYIAECIESILAQTYTNFRLILVDDGTPDGAGKICDEYAKKDPRITVIHQQNAGATRARAHGVEEAGDCEYIAFVDSDDTIATGYLQHLHNGMNEDVDVVLNESAWHPKPLPINKYRTQLIGDNRHIDIGPCNKLFRINIQIYHPPCSSVNIQYAPFSPSRYSRRRADTTLERRPYPQKTGKFDFLY